MHETLVGISRKEIRQTVLVIHVTDLEDNEAAKPAYTHSTLFPPKI
jgi:hypothetical protein